MVLVGRRILLVHSSKGVGLVSALIFMLSFSVNILPARTSKQQGGGGSAAEEGWCSLIRTLCSVTLQEYVLWGVLSLRELL